MVIFKPLRLLVGQMCAICLSGVAAAQPLAGDVRASISTTTKVGFFDKQMEIRLCNNDPQNEVSITVASSGDLGTKVEGWYKIAANRCSSVHVWTNDDKIHYLLFKSDGNIIDFGPKVYEAFGLKFTGSLSRSEKSFCVNLSSATNIQSNILSMGRETSCQGDEVLMRFPVKLNGNFDVAEVNIPAPAMRESNAGHSLSPGTRLMNMIADWFK